MVDILGGESVSQLIVNVDLQKLKIFGRSYLNCLMDSMITESTKNKIITSYFGMALKILTENTQKFAGGNALKYPLHELLEPKSPPKEKTIEEIEENLVKNGGVIIV